MKKTSDAALLQAEIEENDRLIELLLDVEGTLQELGQYMFDKVDGEYFTDSAYPHANVEGQLLGEIDELLDRVKRHTHIGH